MLFNWLLYALLFYMILNYSKVKKRQTRNRRLVSVISSVRHPAEFYEGIEEIINDPKDPEFSNKAKIVKLWGKAYNGNYYNFEETLEDISLWSLMRNGKDHYDIQANEDSFFYLFLAVPNMLAADGRTEEREMIDKKLMEMEDSLQKQMVVALYNEFNKFYDNEGDRGLEFYEKLMIGDYPGYYYTKSLIGLYKDLVTCMAAQIYVEQGDMEKYEDCRPYVERFMRSGVGERWIRNLNLPVVLPEYDEDGNLIMNTAEEAEQEIDAEEQNEAPVYEDAETAAESEETKEDAE